MRISRLTLIGIFLATTSSVWAQGLNYVSGQDTSRRPITTAVPFLMIATDARAGAMGDAGVATSPDANATHWNIAKLAFIKNDVGVQFVLHTLAGHNHQ
jgi:hypothetical protein